MQLDKNGNIDAVKIKSVLIEISKIFKSPANNTILYMNLGKHLQEISFILDYSGDNQRILDIGGGLGVNLIAIKKILSKNSSLFLIDRFEEYETGNRMGGYEEGLDLLKNTGIEVVNQDFWENKTLPFGSDLFDSVTIFDVTEHLPGSPLYLFREINRVLKPGGRIILGGPNSVYILRRIRLLLGNNPYIYFYDWISDRYYSHYREYSKNEQIELLKMTGFKDIKSVMSIEPSRTQAKNRYYYDSHQKFSLRTLLLYIVYIMEIINKNFRSTVYCIGKK